MKSSKHFLPIIFLSGVFLIPEVISQHKFELGVSVDPLVVPVNVGTYIENGPGFYNINGRGKVTQSGSVYFTYWAFNNVGISLGAVIRNFRSQIDYAIHDLFNENLEPMIERSYPFSAKGWGPSLSVLWRKERWRARIGLSIFDLYGQEYKSNSSISGVTIWESGEKIFDIQLEEEAYWHTAPNFYGFLQFEGQYNIFDNLFIKVSLETTGSSQNSYPYTLLISGFTPETSPQDQVLNDYKMRNTLTSFSFGVGYLLGFGKYNHDRKDDGM